MFAFMKLFRIIAQIILILLTMKKKNYDSIIDSFQRCLMSYGKFLERSQQNPSSYNMNLDLLFVARIRNYKRLLRRQFVINSLR